MKQCSDLRAQLIVLIVLLQESGVSGAAGRRSSALPLSLIGRALSAQATPFLYRGISVVGGRWSCDGRRQFGWGRCLLRCGFEPQVSVVVSFGNAVDPGQMMQADAEFHVEPH
jgi:hypothetical protein